MRGLLQSRVLSAHLEFFHPPTTIPWAATADPLLPLHDISPYPDPRTRTVLDREWASRRRGWQEQRAAPQMWAAGEGGLRGTDAPPDGSMPLTPHVTPPRQRRFITFLDSGEPNAPMTSIEWRRTRRLKSLRRALILSLSLNSTAINTLCLLRSFGLLLSSSLGVRGGFGTYLPHL